MTGENWATLGGIATAVVVGFFALRQRKVDGDTATAVADIGADLARAQAVSQLYGTLSAEIARLGDAQVRLQTAVEHLTTEVALCHAERDAATAEVAKLTAEVAAMRRWQGR